MIRVNNWGIYFRILFIAILPVVVFSILFGVYINKERNYDLINELTERGNLISSNLATASEYAVATRNQEQLQILVDAAMTQKDVIGIRVLDETGKLVFKRGGYETKGKGNVRQYLADIVSTALDNSDLALDESLSVVENDEKLLLGTIEVYVSDESYVIRKRSIQNKTLLFILAGVMASIALAMLIGNTLVSPVRDVINVVTAVRHGDLSRRVDNKCGGDLGKLQHGINEMTDTISLAKLKLEQEVQDATSELEKTVEVLKSKNTELDQARNDAMQAKDAKSEFLANMSHEIRTPLNAIIGFSHQLGKTDLNEKQTDYSKTIVSAAKQLLTVIDDVLSFSKLESGKLKIIADEFRLRDCLDNVITMMSPTTKGKELELVLLVDANVPDVVIGDSDRLTQILTNLVNNAVKFTVAGSVVVHVSVENTDREIIRFVVKDTGCGINKKAKEKLFSPFYQENQKTSKRYTGTGLGLVICQRLVSLMGGEIDFTSEEGVGSEFYFTLPLEFVMLHDYGSVNSHKQFYVLDGNTFSRRAIRNNLLHMGATVFTVDRSERLFEVLQVTSQDDASRNVIIVSLPPSFPLNLFFEDVYIQLRKYHKGELIILAADSEPDNLILPDNNIVIIDKPVRFSTLSSLFVNNFEAGKISETPGKQQFKGYNVLVAEDNEFNVKYIKGLLENYGLDVECVGNGKQAINACKQKTFDIILMDLHMPEIDGIDATKTIRSLDSHLETIPVIAISADVFANEDDKLIKQGFTDCMFKPIDENKLASMLEHYLIHNISEGSLTKDKNKTIELDVPSDMQDKLFSELEQFYTQLESLLQNQDLERSRECAHSILGLVAYFKLNRLNERVYELQNIIKEQRYNDALSSLQLLRSDTSDIKLNL